MKLQSLSINNGAGEPDQLLLEIFGAFKGLVDEARKTAPASPSDLGQALQAQPAVSEWLTLRQRLEAIKAELAEAEEKAQSATAAEVQAYRDGLGEHEILRREKVSDGRDRRVAHLASAVLAI